MAPQTCDCLTGMLRSSQAHGPGSYHKLGFFRYLRVTPSVKVLHGSCLLPTWQWTRYLKPVCFQSSGIYQTQACCFTLTKKRIEFQDILACQGGRGLSDHTYGTNGNQQPSHFFWSLLFGGHWRLNSGHFVFAASRAWLPASWLAVNSHGLSVELCHVRLELLRAQVSGGLQAKQDSLGRRGRASLTCASPSCAVVINSRAECWQVGWRLARASCISNTVQFQSK